MSLGDVLIGLSGTNSLMTASANRKPDLYDMQLFRNFFSTIKFNQEEQLKQGHDSYRQLDVSHFRVELQLYSEIF